MLQIVLIGQRELGEKLRSPSLRQLNQRIAIRHHLMPLTFNETVSYIQQRLTVAGAQGNITFSKSALREIYKFSHGVPRLINLLGERILLAGFVEQTYHIHEGLVKKAEKSLVDWEGNSLLAQIRIFLSRSIPWPIAILILLFSLGVGILSTPKTKDFLWARVQGIYSQISGAREEPVLKIGGREQGKIQEDLPGRSPL
jgi:general secretion pathway protein A